MAKSRKENFRKKALKKKREKQGPRVRKTSKEVLEARAKASLMNGTAIIKDKEGNILPTPNFVEQKPKKPITLYRDGSLRFKDIDADYV